MPTPTGTFQRPDLGTAFSQFPITAAKGFVALDVLPLLPVPLQSANYSIIKVEALMRLEDLTRGPGGGYARTEYEVQQTNYSTVEYGLEEVIDDRNRKLYMYSFDAERFARDRLMLRLMTNLEIKVATAVQAISGGAAAKVWSDVAADPIADVRAALIALRALNGLNPQDASMVIDWEVLQYLKDSPAMLDRVKFNGTEQVNRGKITAAAIAEAFGIKELIVAGGVKNTADRGQTRSLSQIWGKTKAVIFHKAGGDIQMPGLGHVVSWNADGSNPEGTFEEYREEQNRSQVLRCRAEFDPHIKYTSAAYTLTSVLA